MPTVGNHSNNWSNATPKMLRASPTCGKTPHQDEVNSPTSCNVQVSKGRMMKLAAKLQDFWARGYFVSTVGLDEEIVLEYIRNQEQEDEHREQLKFGI